MIKNEKEIHFRRGGFGRLVICEPIKNKWLTKLKKQ